VEPHHGTTTYRHHRLYSKTVSNHHKLERVRGSTRVGSNLVQKYLTVTNTLAYHDTKFKKQHLLDTNAGKQQS
jgi:hypothetical protein